MVWHKASGLRHEAIFATGMALLLSGCAALRQFDARSARESYFPLATGDEWEYRLITTVDRGTRQDTTTVAVYEHRITGTAKLADGKPAFIHVWESRVTLRDGLLPDSTFSQSETTWLRKTSSAVYRYLSPNDKPDSILLLPLQIDQRWRSSDVSYWVAGREDLQLEDQFFAGCWRVKSGPVDDPAPSLTWFAKGVGLVRLYSERALAGKRIRTDYFLVSSQIR
jgi:hypothetical protein